MVQNETKEGTDAAYEKALKDSLEANAKFTTADVLGRYSQAKMVKELKDAPDKYGKKVVERLSKDLKRDASVLYADVLVVESWTEEQIKAHADEAATAQTQPLTWHHYVSVARMTDHGLRDELLNEAMTDGLSTRELAVRKKQRLRDDGATDDETDGKGKDDGTAGNVAEDSPPLATEPADDPSTMVLQSGTRNLKAASEGFVSQVRRFWELHKNHTEKRFSEKQRGELKQVCDSLLEVENDSKSLRAGLEKLLVGAPPTPDPVEPDTESDTEQICGPE